MTAARLRRRAALAAVTCSATLLGLGVSPPAAAHELYLAGGAGLGLDLTCIGMSRRDPGFVMVGTSQGAIYRTEDAGATWQKVVVAPSRTLFWGRERSPDSRLEYAPGLPGKSPHLQSWLRQKGLHTAGINMQQLLVQKGDKTVSINWIDVDWNDDRRVYVGTYDGLYQSRDKGRTFVRIFQGRSDASERMVISVASDPFDPAHLLVGTAQGLFISSDGGASFVKTMNYYMRDSYIREIKFDPEQRGLVHVAMGGSAMASPDGGENWITTHWDEWAPRADVQSISLGPQNVRVIGTGDGVFASFQGGEMGTWQRAGFRFVGHTVQKVLATQDPRTWFVTTQRALWVTRDAGQTWSKYFQTGGRSMPQWVTAFRGQTQHLWFITNRHIYRMGMPPSLRGVSARRALPSRVLVNVPPLYELHERVLTHNRLHFRENQGYRERGPWAALLPTLAASINYQPSIDRYRVHDFQYANWPYHAFMSSRTNGLWYDVVAWWDLGRLLFDKRELPHWGRISRNLAGLRQELQERIHRLYVEYRRVAYTLIHSPPADALAHEYQLIRLQEIAAYLDAISGGYWSKNTGGIP